MTSRPLTAEFVEREYNNRALVPDHQDYFDRWERDSDFVRATLPGAIDLAYGPDARQRIDIFPARKGSENLLIFIHGGYWRGLDDARKQDFRFHHISTDEVYGDLEPDEPPFSEVTPYRPSSPYSASKASSDHIVRAWARTYGLPVLVSGLTVTPGTGWTEFGAGSASGGGISATGGPSLLPSLCVDGLNLTVAWQEELPIAPPGTTQWPCTIVAPTCRTRRRVAAIPATRPSGADAQACHFSATAALSPSAYPNTFSAGCGA
jgi:hypothetical protein